MNKIKVKEWISWEESEKYDESVGLMGGWVEGERWKEYLETHSPKSLEYLEALRERILEEKLKVGGDEHQLNYVPLFSDNTVATFSFRGWGDLMAAIWNEYEGKNEYCYMDFYMTCLISKEDNNEEEIETGGSE